MLSRRQQKFVLKHSGTLSVRQIARHLGVPRREVALFLRESQLEEGASSTDAATARECTPPPLPSVPWYWTAAAAAAVFVVSVALYAVTIRYELLDWDDRTYILRNPWLTGLSAANLRGIFTRPYFNNYLPLHILSYSVDRWVGGGEPWAYHLGSVLLNGLNAVLVLLVLLQLSRSFAVAAFGALLFAVQPAHVPAVAWVSSRKELLSFTFVLLSLAAYVASRRSRRRAVGLYLLSVVLFLCAMLSKTTAVVLPGFLLLFDLCERGPNSVRDLRPTGRMLVDKLPYAAIGLLLVYVNTRVQTTAQAAYAKNLLRFALVKGHAVWNYLGVALGIRVGRPIYDLPTLGSGSLGAALDLAGLLLLPASCALLWRYRRYPSGLLAMGWFLLTLAPALAFPLVTYMADRYLYAPSLGVCWALAYGVSQAASLARDPRIRWAIAGAGSTILVSVSMARVLQYLPVWRDDESLWSYGTTRSRDFRAFNNLASARISQERWQEAERLLLLAAKSPNVTSFRNLGVVYYNTGRHEEALQANRRALEIHGQRGGAPGTLAALWFSLGSVHWVRKEYGEAARAWRAALKADPGHPKAGVWLGRAERKAEGG